MAIDPKDDVIDTMTEYFSMTAMICSDSELRKLYYRAKKIPKSKTKAILKESNSGLVLDGILLAEGGRAELIRAFRGAVPLLVKIPFGTDDAVKELSAFEVLGDYNPDEVAIIGPVRKVTLVRESRVAIEYALEMPLLTCSLSLVPRPISDEVLEEVARALIVALEFVHSKGIVHGDVKISNILIQKGKFYLADFGSSAKIGESLISTTVSSLPDTISEDDLIASEGLDWFQGAVVLAQLKNYIFADDRTNSHFLYNVFSGHDDGTAVRYILSKL
jgi:hypothetical protein